MRTSKSAFDEDRAPVGACREVTRAFTEQSFGCFAVETQDNYN